MNDHIAPIIEDIKSRRFEAFEDILARKDSEKFFVDFKLTEKEDYSGQRTLYNSDKKNFGKAISGFGDSEGGIIIWGIDASGSVDDFAKALKPIKGVDNFKSLLESFVSLLTVPSHRTVESLVIKKSSKDTEGLVVTIIPKGEDRPYQNIEDYKYYMRAGDSFVPVPHGVLQGMFGRAPQSNTFFMFNIRKDNLKGPRGEIQLQIGMMAVNDGLGIAEDIYGFVRAWNPGDNCEIKVDLTDHDHYEYSQAYGLEFSFMSKTGFRLGYQQRSQMLVLDIKLAPPFKKDLQVDLMMGARGQQVYRRTIKKTSNELDEIYSDFSVWPDLDVIKEIWETEDKKS